MGIKATVIFFNYYRPTPLVAIGNPKGFSGKDDDEEYEDGELPHKVIKDAIIASIFRY